MSGALNSVLGGGNVLGAALNIASMCFPPLAIANGLNNMLMSAIGGAINGAIDSIMKECGMPKFIGDIVKDIVGKLMQQNTQPCDKACGDSLQDKVGDKFKDFKDELMSDITDAFKKFKGEEDKKCGNGNGSGGGKSWFVALMKALGEVQNAQAAKVEKLSKEVSDALGAGDDSAGSKQAQFDKMEEFKAEAKLQEFFANVAKSVGDSLSNAINTVGRPQ